MLRVFADAGLAVRRRLVDDVIELTMPIPREAALGEDSAYLDAVAGREQRADVASLAPLLAPRSIAVVGVSRRQGSIGRTILLNIRDAGFEGALFAVNPHAKEIEGVPSLPSVSDLPTVPDLAVVAVPSASVLKVARECGKLGVGSLVVITSGLGAAGDARLLEACRRYGMRLVGPNCFGVAVPRLGLDATFATRHPAAGIVGLVVQSGGVGIAMLEHFTRLGIGISSFASVGDKMDVSGNDLLMWWEQDAVTKLAVMYLESFGNPRKFARTARRVSADIPVLTVHAGRSAPGQRAAASHTAAVAAPLITRQALFEQAGIIATTSLGALLDTAALLANQPVPAGRRVAIVTNAGGGGVLAADACVEAGLTVTQISRRAQTRLRRLLPNGAAVGGPVDTTAAVSVEQFRDCLLMVAKEPAGEGQDPPDAVIALIVPTAASDLLPALQEVRLPVPLAAVVLGQPEAVRILPASNGGPAVPAYAYPEGAAGALGRAARYGAWRSRPAGTVPEIAGLQQDHARALVGSFLERIPGGGWLSPAEADELLRSYGLPVVDSRFAVGTTAVLEAAAALGGEVALKADVAGLVHKSGAGAVELGVRGPAEVRRALRRLERRFGDRLAGVLVQPMITGGTEVIIGVVQEPVFGPLVVFGLGGVATEFLGDHAARLAPLTDSDADDLIHEIRAAPLLLGHRGPAGRRYRGTPRRTDAHLPARRRPAAGGRARPQPGHRPPGRRVRGGCTGKGHEPRGGRSVPAPAPARRPRPHRQTRRRTGRVRFSDRHQAGPDRGRAADAARLLARRQLPVRRPDLPDGQPAAERAAAAGGHQAAAARPLGHDPGPQPPLRPPQPGDPQPGSGHDLRQRARATAGRAWWPTPTWRAPTPSVYPHITRDAAGLGALFRQFSFPGGIPSHAAPETPGSIHEGGELGYSLATPTGRRSTTRTSSSPAWSATARPRPGRWPTSWHSQQVPRTRHATARCCRSCT